MSCVLEIKDLVREWSKTGTMSAIPGLTVEETAGVLAAITNSVDQPADVVTEKGLGSYGLSLADLQQTGVVKKGISTTGDLENILLDPSVFTGKYAVSGVTDLLINEGLQRRLMNEVMITNVETLIEQGVITGEETTDVTAALAGALAKSTPAEVTGNIITNLLGKITGFIDDAMDILGKLAAFGALLALIKSADLLEKIKGIGGGSVSLPEINVGTIEIPDINAGVDDIVGSAKIPSVGDVESAAQEATASAVEGAKAAIPEVPEIPTVTIPPLPQAPAIPVPEVPALPTVPEIPTLP